MAIASALLPSLPGTTEVALLSLVLVVPLLLEMVQELLLVLFPILVADVDVVDPAVVDAVAAGDETAAEGGDAVDVVTVLVTGAVATDAAVVAVVFPVVLGS